MEVKVQKLQLHRPSLEEVAEVLGTGLSKNFNEVQVSVVACPDLSVEPYQLVSQGLCNSPRLMDIGGIPYLNPIPLMDKIYDLKDVPRWCDLTTSNVSMIGAGAGPSHLLEGTLAEMMTNARIDKVKETTFNQSKICKLCENGTYLLEDFKTSCECMHMMNLYISEGKPGKVIEVKAKQRTGNDDFLQTLQSALRCHYETVPVGLGGVFLLAKGKAKCHVMPCYSKVPLETDNEIKSWLKFFEMSSPLTCVGYLMSYDPGFNLRMEHFHCFSKHGDGGHFHHDTTPHEAEYIGYFNIPEYMYRVDNYGTQA